MNHEESLTPLGDCLDRQLRMLQAILDTDEDCEEASDCSGVVSKSSVRKSDTDDSVSDRVQTDTSELSLSVVVDSPKDVGILSVNGASIKEEPVASILK